MNINLIGMRGVGKSNVARRLSVLTKMPVMATDVLATYESGMTIPEFVAERGWPAFRALEAEILGKLASVNGVIVDCGGGILVDVDVDGLETYSPGKVEVLRAGGPVVYLRGDIARLAAKTADDPTRPTLDQVRGAEEIMRRREPFYQRAADWELDVAPGQRQAAAEAIADHFDLSVY